MKLHAAALLIGSVLFSQYASAQAPDKPDLASITLNNNSNLIGEVRSENAANVVVFDLNSGDEKTIKKTDIKGRMTATDTQAIGRVGLPRFLAWRIGKAVERPTTGKIAEVTPSTIYLTLGEKDGVEAGKTLTVFREDGDLTDPDTGNVIGKKRSRLAKIETTEVKDSYSKAKVLGDLEVELKVGDVVEQDGVVQTVAILPFLDVDGEETAASKTLLEQITTVLVNRGISVVDRKRLDDTLAELALQQSKAFDQATAQKVGSQLGAATILTGTIAPKGNKSEAHVRLIRVETGEIIAAASQDIVTTTVSSGSGSTTSGGPKNVKSGFAQQFSFAAEKEIRANWQLNANDNLWSIENNSLKFSVAKPATFPTANVDLRYKLDGEVAVEVAGRLNRSSELTLHFFGEQIVVKGPFRVQLLRQGTALKINNNGIFSTKQIKESWANQPSGFKMSWRVENTGGGDCWITSVAVKATKAEKEVTAE